jgi:predicted SAM-dependent methyltransferase
MTKQHLIAETALRYFDFLRKTFGQGAEILKHALGSIPVFSTGLYKSKYILTGTDLKLDLGCGPVKRKGFIGINLEEPADLIWDLRWGIPFGPGSVGEIRSDHFFEHLMIDDLMYIFKECHRVLKSGGKLDFTVPHLDPYIKPYLKNDVKTLKSLISDIPREHKALYNNSFDILFWLLYRDGAHKSFFDRRSVILKLKNAGFKQISLRNYSKSKDLDKRYSSIYVVAIK